MSANTTELENAISKRAKDDKIDDKDDVNVTEVFDVNEEEIEAFNE